MKKGSGLTHVNKPEETDQLLGLWNHFLLVARVSAFLASKLDADPSLALNLGIAVHLGNRLRKEAVAYAQARFSGKHNTDSGTINDQEVLYALDMLKRDSTEVPEDLITLIGHWSGMRPIEDRVDLNNALLCAEYADLRCSHTIVTLGERFVGQFKRFWMKGREKTGGEDCFAIRDDELAKIFTDIIAEIGDIEGQTEQALTEMFIAGIEEQLAGQWEDNHDQYPIRYVIRGYVIFAQLEKKLREAGMDMSKLATECAQVPEWETRLRRDISSKLQK